MPDRALRPCKHVGCPALTRDKNGYCTDHSGEARSADKRYEASRGGSTKQGYTYRWQQYAKRFLSQPENQICKLHLPGCTLIARCVDHIDPPNGPNDPRFWDKSNHQGACIRCNSVKGHKKMKGNFEL